MTIDFTLAVVTAPKKDSLKWKNEVVNWSDIRQWMDEPANKKECGNYVLGRLSSDGRRKNSTVEARSALTLDVDHPDPQFLDRLGKEPYLHLWHTTHSSTPDNPRYRIIIPLSREVTPAEYEAAIRGVMEMLGEQSGFDPGSIEYARYMFKPASQKPEWFQWAEHPGDIADADELIANAPESLAGLPPIKPTRWKQNPFEMAGIVGEFNQAYDDLDLLIEEYELPYEKAGDKRWTLKGAIASAAGVGEVAPGLWYSHHGGDPAHGEAQTAFDLVRLHLFGELDEDVKTSTPVNKRPSHGEMKELAARDVRVLNAKWAEPSADFSGVDRPAMPATPTPAPNDASEASQAPSDWRMRLHLTLTGLTKDDLHNWDLIRSNDPNFTALVFNKMTRSVEVDADLDWRKYEPTDRGWTDYDLKNLKEVMERKYKLKAPKERLDDMVTNAAFKRTINPVVDYLKSLDGRWDGKARLETCLPGVKVTDFTRLVARKSLVAAVARAMQPGVKWDHTLIFFGNEGLGKSEWIDRMSKGWTDDLGDIRNKDTLLEISRTWIVVSDEGNSLKKADADAQKAFLTRKVDVFRAPYDRQVTDHPRRCVIWGSTNDDVFLRRQQGNRRFLIVHTENKVNLDLITPTYVDQVWAEAYLLWQKGEQLYLTDDESAMAVDEREQFTEDDSLAGQIGDFLDMPVPQAWMKMGQADRLQHYRDYRDGLGSGDSVIDRACPRQIWYEMLGEMRSPSPADLRIIRESMKNVPGWRRMNTPVHFNGYGTQRAYERFDPTAEIEELI